MTASGPAGAKGAGLPGGHQQRRSRAGRVRTVLTEKQLSLLKNCYVANPRPDALMKEQMVEMSGLSPRVIRVWFQNKRCKDKKRQQLQQSKVRTNLTYLGAIHKRRLLKGPGEEGGVKNVRIYVVKIRQMKREGGHKMGKLDRRRLWMRASASYA